MAGEKVFIVEDERIVAEDLARMLTRLGYDVVGTATDGDEAIKKMAAASPQLVLMDIRIQGVRDGVEVAEEVVALLDIPVIYLTAYADEATVDRAKTTLPAGYILKPFEERSLKATIDMSLYRHRMERLIQNIDVLHGGILNHLPAAVLAADTKGNIHYMNKAAEILTGHSLSKAYGKSPANFFSFHNTDPRLTLASRLTINRDGRSILLDCQESPVKDPEGRVMGAAFVLREIKDPAV